MTIKELFDQSIRNDYTDLQALIMFLVYDKKVLTMEDDSKELDLYFLSKHNERMNKELHSYKQKMKLDYGLRVYKMISDHKVTYILAKSEKQAKLIASRNNVRYTKVKLKCEDTLMNYNGIDMLLRDVIRNKKPKVLGGY